MVATEEIKGNREKLLAGAVECLRDRGYAATTARDLVAASGANLASIGYHFGGKEALMNEAVAETTRAWMRSIEREVWSEDSVDLATLVRRVIEVSVGRFDELEPYLRSFVESFPPAVRSEALRREMAAAYEDVRATGAELLGRAVWDASAAQARALTSVLIALCDGLILQWLLDPRGAPEPDDVVEALSLLGSIDRGQGTS